MTKTEILTYQKKYHNELFNNVVPFWLSYSTDKEQGGYFSCIDRDGTVFDTDKFTWMQGRAIWMFSKLYNSYGKKTEGGNQNAEKWLEAAKHGTNFMRQNGQAPNGDFYFALNQEGKPLIEPYNIFSDCFMCIAYAEYFRASNEEWAKETALKIYRRIQERKTNPKGVWTKQNIETRSLCAMAFPMIQCWMARELKGFIPATELTPIIDENIHYIMHRHIDRDLKCVFERVLPDGGHLFNIMEGRLLNPGHALEVLWFVMLLANDCGQKEIVAELADVMLWCIERGWDEKYGGIFYYRDYKNFPTEKLESDMKLWWVHNEALAAFLLAFKLTGEKKHEEWFRRIDEYTWKHFPDPVHGEWFGYLNRQGEPALTLKGGKWKGFFHLPRMLMVCEQWFEEMLLEAGSSI